MKGIGRGEFPNIHPILDKYIRRIWKDVELVKDIKMRHWQHGKCAEVNALDQLLYYLENKHGKLNLDQVKELLFDKTISKALDMNRDISKHGRFKNACKSCNPMLKFFNIIEDITDLKR